MGFGVAEVAAAEAEERCACRVWGLVPRVERFGVRGRRFHYDDFSFE